ncbi:TOMM precursor leader peptide-binding protein [Amycolatopsis pittospori]|uniref:TOMM precursor leader peptide-binding protein n=1 Tax=Amycolatopsis pittospori TaxID=2749434 RepID=UPI0015EFFEEC|nr:TOMM precursor leader peptide-binding protein [Amycolatopsis pittospori]
MTHDLREAALCSKWLRGERSDPAVRIGLAAEPVPGALVVAVLNEWTVAGLEELAGTIAAAGARFLPVRADGVLTVIGPITGPGLAGCVRCAELGRVHALDLPADPEARLGGAFPPSSFPALAALVRLPAAHPEASLLWQLDNRDGTFTTHTVPIRPGCPECAPLPADEPESARFTPLPRPVPRGVFRQENRLTTGPAFVETAADSSFGPVTALGRTDRSPMPLVSAATVVGKVREWSFGRSATVADAERVAVFEALERRLALRPHGRRTVVRASFADLGADRAVDPASLGLPDPEFTGLSDACTPYRPDLPISWVHGWSMTRDRALAVPEHFVYYGVPARPETPRVLVGNSNGNGLGNSPEEAALAGLLEVVERDAFLMAWYANAPLRRIAPPEGDDLAGHLADDLARIGYELLLFDATTEFGIPVVLSLARQRSELSPLPQVYFSAGAHPDPLVALRSAIVETAVGAFRRADRAAPDAEERHRLERMLEDPTLVRRLDDHIDLHRLPSARKLHEFLLSDPSVSNPLPYQEVLPEAPEPETDLTRVLTGLVDRLAAYGLDTVVVDQTDDWSRGMGLHAVKVVVPGTLRLTFGHLLRATANTPRLLTVPRLLGRTSADLALADLPRHPHPFN